MHAFHTSMQNKILIHFALPSTLPCSRVPVTLPSSCKRRNQWFLPNSFTLVTVFSASSVAPVSFSEKMFRLILAADHWTVLDWSNADFVNTQSLVLAQCAVISTSDRLFICVLKYLVSISKTLDTALRQLYLLREKISSLKRVDLLLTGKVRDAKCCDTLRWRWWRHGWVTGTQKYNKTVDTFNYLFH